MGNPTCIISILAAYENGGLVSEIPFLDGQEKDFLAASFLPLGQFTLVGCGGKVHGGMQQNLPNNCNEEHSLSGEHKTSPLR